MFNNPFEMVVAIVLIVTVGRIISGRAGGRRNRMQNFVDAPQPDPDADRMRDEIKTLKERIAVLERIATDGNSAAQLDREIEKLR
jgi:hypothetical protein